MSNSNKVFWDIDREERIGRALSILGPERPRFPRDDMRAAVDEIHRLRGVIYDIQNRVAPAAERDMHTIKNLVARHASSTVRSVPMTAASATEGK